MSFSHKQILAELSKADNYKLLKNSEHALERETLRINKNGEISDIEHPEEYGSPLVNPYISTDFAEPQLELITPTYKSEKGALNFLIDIHAFIVDNLPKGEALWPFSMPAKLPVNHEKIPLAKYGTSNPGKKRTDYRRGLGNRYGRRMQTISGVHYNFSFSKELWELLYKKFAHPGESLKEFITNSYFRMIGNFLEISWIDSYLFGASPAIDKSYLDKKPRDLSILDKNTYYGKYATSLRMSSYGYCCKVQAGLNVSFKDIESYVRDLKKATSTMHRKYSKIGLEKRGVKQQLNNNILQIPNEYYAAIRPKQPTNLNEDLLDKLLDKGVKYVEVRTVDINPLSPIGVNEEHLKFLHSMMIYCLLKDSINPTEASQLRNMKNHNSVATNGRDQKLKLNRRGQKIRLQTWASQILLEIIEAAKLLDKNYKDNRYTKIIESQIEKIENPELTPSAKILKLLYEKSFLSLGCEIAKSNLAILKDHSIHKSQLKRFRNESKNSLKEKRRLEILSRCQTEGYEDMEFSTQILIKEAFKRKIEVEVLERQDNFIRLKKGKKLQLIKQATFTELDSVISYFINANKAVTKKILREKGIKTPSGGSYSTIEDAMENYTKYAKNRVVVKPTTANYGIGINFISPGDKIAFKKAIVDGLAIDKTVIVEEFIEGDEYRFLVIGNKVAAIMQRIPANVIGDGKSTIKQLVEEKNFYRFYPGIIKLGKPELAKLKSQNLKPSSILQEGRKIFLRDNSNISTGGDAIAISKMPKSFKQVALKAAKTSKSKICGVDMIIKGKSYSIIELNYNPVLKPHQFPHVGKPSNVAAQVLDLLGF